MPYRHVDATGIHQCLHEKQKVSRSYWLADLSEGMAVHARLCEVPAEICCTRPPHNAVTSLGLVTGPWEWPSPHWPIALFPHAYTSQSVTQQTIANSKLLLQFLTRVSMALSLQLLITVLLKLCLYWQRNWCSWNLRQLVVKRNRTTEALRGTCWEKPQNISYTRYTKKVEKFYISGIVADIFTKFAQFTDEDSILQILLK